VRSLLLSREKARQYIYLFETLLQLLKNLVERRKLVKQWMKKATGLKVQQFDIQQQALKLTANRYCIFFLLSCFQDYA